MNPRLSRRKSINTIDTESSQRHEFLATELWDAESSDIDGFLIDLDGTMYQPGGLIPGAREFFRWLKDSGKFYVFLSNTGAKNALSVQQKFRTPPYVLDDEPVSLRHIFTAAEAQVDFMLATVPPHARVLVISGGSGVWRDDLRTRGGARGEELYNTWQIRTELSDDEAKEWAACSACSRLTKLVWVAFFTDGQISKGDGDNGEGFSDWGFEMIKTAGFLLSHGAQFIYTADDAYNPSVDPKHPGMMFPLPGPGMFAEMMKKLMYPHGKEYIWCAGKGGNVGGQYMMQRAISMLVAQGHSGDRNRIVMVGDRFDTDIRAGLSVDIRTCLVTSGCHNLECQQYYRMDPAHYYAPCVMHLTTSDAKLVAAATRPSEEPSPGEALREWSMAQGNLLRPNSDACRRDSLRPRLSAYFAMVDRDRSGSIDREELIPALTMLGMSSSELHPSSPVFADTELPAATRQKLKRMLGGSGGVSEGRKASTSSEVSRASSFSANGSTAASEAADGPALDFEEFSSVVEAALRSCGIEARLRWKKVSLLHKVSTLLPKNGAPPLEMGALGKSASAPALATVDDASHRTNDSFTV